MDLTQVYARSLHTTTQKQKLLIFTSGNQVSVFYFYFYHSSSTNTSNFFYRSLNCCGNFSSLKLIQMKGRVITFFVLLSCGFVSCWHHRGDVSIQYKESDAYYSMDAWFHENRTIDVEEYMDDKIGEQSNMSFANTRMDGRIGLDDHTTFFIKKIPGHLRIELDKRINSTHSYREIKSLCEGIKEVLK